MENLKKNKIVRWLVRIAAPLLDLPRLLFGVIYLPRFLRDLFSYRSISGQRISFADLHPVLGQHRHHEFDRHYIFLGAWAARRIVAFAPQQHTDVGSQVSFATVLGAAVPVQFVEFRKVPIKLTGFDSIAGDLLNLPFSDNSIYSLSCLHVIEHVGLGRYGDPLDPLGTVKAARELSRVLRPGGQLLIGIPQGRPRICFNAHRVHDSAQVLAMFADLRLVEFSGVNDQGEFLEGSTHAILDDCEYGCGFYRFTK